MALRRIHAGKAEREELENLTDVIEVIAAFDGAAGKATSIATFTAVAPKVVSSYRVAFTHAHALGTQACPPLPESPAYVAAIQQAVRAGDPAPPLPTEESQTTETTETTDAPAPTAESDSGDATVLGNWRGKVTQYGPGDQRARYVVELSIDSTVPGEQGASSSYPRYGCDGALRVSSADDNQSVALFREEIVRGKSRCYGDKVAKVRVQLSSASDRLAWRWRGHSSKGTPIEALGTLRRR